MGSERFQQTLQRHAAQPIPPPLQIRRGAAEAGAQEKILRKSNPALEEPPISSTSLPIRSDEPPEAEGTLVEADTWTSEATASEVLASKPGEVPGSRARSEYWREDTVWCLLTMSSALSDADPCPEITSVFIDPLRALTMALEIGKCGPVGTPFREAEAEEAALDEPSRRLGQPKLKAWRVVTNRKDVLRFGPFLAAAADVCGRMVGGERVGLEAVLLPLGGSAGLRACIDLRVRGGAMAGQMFAEGRPVSERWIRWVWGGRVQEVIEDLAARCQDLGTPTRTDKEEKPRRVVPETWTCLATCTRRGVTTSTATRACC